ncbi:outer dense fiber protein 3 isoform X2 [Aricia agestis]|uniref:outer dense fiber protein 3 isoform X2 n=1 Tax=Aricia agestis TaxID=91739 RepID=UPI001C207493|nr:outer dense fiber protein 3 isoform X2 [Aricia agestis]
MGRKIGPGPGAYLLPPTVGYNQHDPSRYRMPMYSFGVKPPLHFGSRGPGPVYRIEKMTREGIISAPAWSLGARFPTRTITTAPGPGAHAPELCPIFKEFRPPMYSMGARFGTDFRRIGPAPNAYSVLGNKPYPAYSMGARLGTTVKVRSPGPAVYYQQNIAMYKYKAPSYSLGGRRESGKYSRSPGPAAYPPDLYNTKKSGFSYSFGRKHGDDCPPMITDADSMECL